MIRNIIWDVNGTLFDTYPAITFAFSNVLKEMGVVVALNVIDGLVRQSFDKCVDGLSERFKLDPNLLSQKFTESYRTISPVNQPPFHGVSDVCMFIHQNGGLNIAVTHRTIQSTQKLLNAHNMSDLIDDIISTTQGYPHKPDPAVILAAIENHKLIPAETLLVGDREIDVQAGRSAGVYTCLFGRKEISEPADIVVDDFGQLLMKLSKDEQLN